MFDSIFFNGDEYNQMWLNGNKIWEKNSGGGEEIVYPYPDADSVITFRNIKSVDITGTFAVIDNTLPYSINGVNTNTFAFPASSETQVKLVNLKPAPNHSSLIPTNIEQLRIPNLTDLSYLFQYFCYKDGYEYSWSPQYFEFNQNPTIMKYMFGYCKYLTDEMMAQFMPHLESFNYSNVTDMTYMFYNCSSLTQLDLSNAFMYMPKATGKNIWIFSNMSSLETAKVPMLWMPSSNQQCLFQGCTSLKEADIMNIDTSHSTFNSNEFYSVNGATVYVGENWTLGTSSTTGNGTNLTFIKKVVPIEFIGSLNCSVNPNNVKVQDFTIKPNIVPTVYSYSDLEVIYDSTYVILDGLFDFELLEGSQGKSFDITYRSKSDNSISRTITITVSEDLDISWLADYTKPYEDKYYWLTEEASGTYKFQHEECSYDSSFYGLTNSYCNGKNTFWSCYKLVAPTTGDMKIKYRIKTYNSSNPFTIHITSDATQPSYSSSTNRILKAYGTSYPTTDYVVETQVVAGETYYIHFQYYGNGTGTYGACVRSIELIPLIKSINGFTYDVDLNNVEQQVFTVIPNIKPTSYNTNDLEIVYDSNYMSVNPTTFEIRLIDGCQGMSHTVTYRSKADNNVSKSITFYVSENLTSLPYLVNLQQFPTWFTEANKKSKYYYTYGTYNYDSTLYGLVEDSDASSTNTFWTCYKLVAPITGSLEITFRANIYRSSYPFTIHSTSSVTQPNYESTTDRIISVTDTSYRDTDGVASINVVQGKTYYIHIQHYRYRSSSYSSYSSCIRSIELIPTE